MALFVGAYTDIGTRKANNQDAYGLRVVENELWENAFAIVCDGIGGMSEGEMASGVAVQAFLEWFDTHVTELFVGSLTQEDIFAQWEELACRINTCVFRYGEGKGLHVGTTATVFLAAQGQGFVMNIGDTRLYGLDREGLRQITKDHTLVQQEVDQGRLPPEAAQTDKRKNILVRCLGAEAAARPDFYSGPIRSDSVYLLCTDGFRNTLAPEELSAGVNPSGLTEGVALTATLRSLAELAKSRGERDNITAVALCIRPEPDRMEQTVDLEDTIDLRYAKEFLQPEAVCLWQAFRE